MAFFYPLIWLGALAVGVPIWLHLRRRQERNLVRFSALRFLEDQPVPRRSPLRLRDILLFALRLLAVLLLVSAFAWPYFQSEVFTESRVYLVDNTLSHQAGDGFSRARGRLLDDLAGVNPQTQVAVIELAGRSRLLSGFSDPNAAALRKVRNLEPSYQRGSYIDVLRQADMLLSNTITPRKRLVMYTDYQKNQWEEILGSPSFFKGVETELSETPKPTAPNLSVARPEVQRTFVGNRTLADLSVELSHLGEAKTAVWTLTANGREILSRPVDLENQPRTITLTAQWEADPRAALSGSVRVAGRPDALAGDDVVFFSLPPMREGSLVVMTRSPFVKTALSPEVMKGYWAARFLEPPGVIGELRSKTLADVLVVETPFLHYGPVRELMQRYLDNDHGVLLIVSYTSPLVRGVLDRLGFELQPDPSAEAAASSFRYVFSDHPVFRPFRSPDFGNLMEIKVRRYRRMKSTQALPLIFAQSGDPLLFHLTPPKGQMFVCPFAFDRSETNWPIHPTFVPFLDLCLQNARRKAIERTTFEPGEMVIWDVPAEKKKAAEETANASDGVPAESPETPAIAWTLRSEDREVASGEAREGRVEFAVPDEPGLYTFTYDDETTAPIVLSVNPSPLESDLTYLESSEPVRLWLSGIDPETGTARKPVRADGALGLPESQILRQPIWWFLLMAGLALLLVECIWVAARRSLA